MTNKAFSTSSPYPGVVKLFIKTEPLSRTRFVGSAVFIEPDTLMTSNHQIANLFGANTSEELLLFFSHPETGALEPVKQIRNVDLKSDTIILKTYYRSKWFYPLSDMDYSQISANESARQVITVGYPFNNFKIIEGQVWNQYDFFVSAEMFFSLDVPRGISGGAVFHKDTGALIGMIVQTTRSDPFQFHFISAKHIKHLLSSEPVKCQYSDCIRQQTDEILQQTMNGDPKAQWLIANIISDYVCETDESKQCFLDIMLILLQSAEKGYIPAMVQLCAFTISGLMTIKKNGNIKENLFYCEQAANRGDIAAMHLLGIFYFAGLQGTAKDYVRASRWFQKSAERGRNAQAQLKLGLMLFAGGNGIEQDLSKAVCLLQSANKQLPGQYGSDTQQFLDRVFAQYVCVPEDISRGPKKHEECLFLFGATHCPNMR